MVKFNVTNINNKYNTKIGYSKLDFSDNLKIIIEKVKDRISREIPDKGYFRSFAEDFPCSEKNIFGRSFSICVERDEMVEGNALLMISLLHPCMNKEASVMLINGDRNALLEYISRKDFTKEIESKVLELSESLKQG